MESRLSLTWREARETLALAGPIVAGQLGQVLIGIVDSLMIGQVGAVPLAAASFAGNLFNTSLVVGIGLLMPISVFSARQRGAGDLAGAGQTLRDGNTLAFAASLGFMTLLLGAMPWLNWLGQPPEVVAVVGPYYLFITASLLPSLLFFSLKSYSEALGHAWPPMVITVGAVLLNAGLNWMFIHGEWGAPALGLTGAGVATLIARLAMVVALALWVARLEGFRLGRGERRGAAAWGAWIPRGRLRAFLQMGLPTAGQLLFETGAFAVAALMMGWLGTVALAAHQVAISCAAFTFMVPLGLSIAVGIRISAALGEGKRERLRPIGFGALGMSTLAMGFFALGFFAAGDWLAAQFVEDQAVVRVAAQLLAVAGLFQIFDGGQVVGMGALRGMADVKTPALLAFSAYWLVALPLGYVLAFVADRGAVGVWTGLAMGLAAAALALTARFARQTRRARPAG